MCLIVRKSLWKRGIGSRLRRYMMDRRHHLWFTIRSIRRQRFQLSWMPWTSMAYSTTWNTTCKMDKHHKQCKCKIRWDKDNLVASKDLQSMVRARLEIQRWVAWSRSRGWTCKCTINKCKWWEILVLEETILDKHHQACHKERCRCQNSSRWCSRVCRQWINKGSRWETKCRVCNSHRKGGQVRATWITLDTVLRKIMSQTDDLKFDLGPTYYSIYYH